MTAVGCGTVEVNPPQHSIKQREKCGLVLWIYFRFRRNSGHGRACHRLRPVANAPELPFFRESRPTRCLETAHCAAPAGANAAADRPSYVDGRCLIST